MKKYLLIAALSVFLGSATLMAEGVPSNSKLDQLGLSGLNVAGDEAGEQVRGHGFGAGYYTYAVAVADPILLGNTSTAALTGAYTFGQDPRASVGAFVAGQGGVDPVAPGAPLTVNLATPNFVATASSFGIIFGQGN